LVRKTHLQTFDNTLKQQTAGTPTAENGLSVRMQSAEPNDFNPRRRPNNVPTNSLNLQSSDHQQINERDFAAMRKPLEGMGQGFYRCLHRSPPNETEISI
jgi:hypothetical protein